MSAHVFEHATLLRASAKLHEAREELEQLEGLDELYGHFLDRLDDLRNEAIDTVTTLDELIEIPCKSIDGRLRCTTTVSASTCEQPPLETLDRAEAAA